MKVSYDEGVASHVGPESCVAVREGVSEALTGERAGRVLSLENLILRSADVVPTDGRQQRRVHLTVHHTAETYANFKQWVDVSIGGTTFRASDEKLWNYKALIDADAVGAGQKALLNGATEGHINLDAITSAHFPHQQPD
jgi:hypothetical protein